MNFRWLWGDSIPVGIKLTGDERLRLRSLAKNEREENPHYARALARSHRIYGVIVLTPLIAVTGFRIIMGFGTSDWDMPIFLAIGVAGYMYGRHRTHAPFIWRALTRMGKPVCWRCGYPLIGLAGTSSCPECGWNREGGA